MADIAREPLEKLYCIQKPMKDPFFKSGHHHEFSDDTVLPFFEARGSRVHGKAVCLDPSQHDFWGCSPPKVPFGCSCLGTKFSHTRRQEEPSFIIEELYSPHDIENIQRILRNIEWANYPHLIKPLATYHHKNKYYLIVPNSYFTLWEYCDNRRTPRFDRSTVLWALKQMQGIANTVVLIHDVVLLHGNLTAFSVRWDNFFTGIDDKNGVLKIDLGYPRWRHGLHDEGVPEAEKMFERPPHTSITPAYDIWSLGCLYLEFLTWLLMGQPGNEQFQDYRSSRDELGIDTDRYWTYEDSNGKPPKKKINDQVIRWFEVLHQNQQCSPTIHDTLDVIRRCLRVEPAERITALGLHETLDRIVKRVEEDEEYLLGPASSTQTFDLHPQPKATAPVMNMSSQTYPKVEINETFITAVSEWIRKCSQHHSFCQGRPEATFPSRVLDLEPEGEFGLRLWEANGASGRYICLSHCWGDSVSIENIKTTSNRLRHYCQGIDLATLPKTFREAVLVTRMLGIRYLWIDSLCILQDSEDDWTKESSEMGRIFEGAYLVLAAAHSKDSSGGLLPKRRPPLVKWLPSEDDDGILLQGIDHCERKYPLLHRAWVFQERFLARRVLFFLENELLWECSDAVSCQCVRAEGNIAGWHTFDSYRCRISNSFDQDNAALRFLWNQTVQKYSGLNLTFPKDKLPALSGIAKRILSGREDEYLAGMWKSTLAEDLAWRVEENCASRLTFWRAPTWSWASVDGRIRMPNIKKQDCCAEIIHAHCKPSGADPTGAVLEGSLVLKSRVIRSLRSDKGIPLCYYHDRQGTQSVARIYPDFTWTPAEDASFRLDNPCCLKIGTLDNGRYVIEYFLILRATNEGYAYERIGLLEIHLNPRVQGRENKETRLSEINDITAAVEESPIEVVTII